MTIREHDAWVAVRDNCLLAQQFVDGITPKELLDNVERTYATVRAPEIVSEAARRLRGDQQARFPDHPWRMIEDAGNVYRYGYDSLLTERILETVVVHVPELLSAADIALDRHQA